MSLHLTRTQAPNSFRIGDGEPLGWGGVDTSLQLVLDCHPGSSHRATPHCDTPFGDPFFSLVLLTCFSSCRCCSGLPADSAWDLPRCHVSLWLRTAHFQTQIIPHGDVSVEPAQPAAGSSLQNAASHLSALPGSGKPAAPAAQPSPALTCLRAGKSNAHVPHSATLCSPLYFLGVSEVCEASCMVPGASLFSASNHQSHSSEQKTKSRQSQPGVGTHDELQACAGRSASFTQLEHWERQVCSNGTFQFV